MNYLNGGYVMLDKADSNIYAKASGALKAGKPILWYEDKNTCYYIDTLAKSGDDIVLTKGGKTITITDANVVTESGNVQNQLHKYYIEIEGDDSNIDTRDIIYDFYSFEEIETPYTITDFEDINKYVSYCKVGFDDELDKFVSNNGYSENKYNFTADDGSSKYIAEADLSVKIRKQ